MSILDDFWYESKRLKARESTEDEMNCLVECNQSEACDFAAVEGDMCFMGTLTKPDTLINVTMTAPAVTIVLAATGMKKSGLNVGFPSSPSTCTNT